MWKVSSFLVVLLSSHHRLSLLFGSGRIFKKAALPKMKEEERYAIYSAMNSFVFSFIVIVLPIFTSRLLATVVCLSSPPEPFSVLAAIHTVDIKEVGLTDYGKTENYVKRQVPYLLLLICFHVIRLFSVL
jgi:hypothetical protein